VAHAGVIQLLSANRGRTKKSKGLVRRTASASSSWSLTGSMANVLSHGYVSWKPVVVGVKKASDPEPSTQEQKIKEQKSKRHPTRDGQVHPIASSGYFCWRIINRFRFLPHPEVPSLSLFGKEAHSVMERRRSNRANPFSASRLSRCENLPCRRSSDRRR
jgi:hypothetical protein